MSELDVIIPVYNESDSIRELLARLKTSLSQSGIDYRLIFVDDHSTDGTKEKIEGFLKSDGFANGELGLNLGGLIYDARANSTKTNGNSKILLLTKNGKKGKAFSILEGAKEAKAPYIAMIDSDLQYPPEVIPRMYSMTDKYDVIVANRKTQKIPFLRRIASRINYFIFERILHGFNVDTQSGLKIFRKEVIENLREEDVTEWTLDLPLLIKAKELGYRIGSIDIDFEKRKYGTSKLKIFKASLEIAKASLKLKIRKKKIFTFNSSFGDSLVGAGLIYRGKKFITHTNLLPEVSAVEVLVGWQKLAILTIVLLILLGLLLNLTLTIVLLSAFLTSLYFLDLLFSFYILSKSIISPVEIRFKRDELSAIPEESLPVYSVLCPLYKESKILPHFIEAIDAIDWPKEKLDVILLLEEEDQETRQALYSLKLPNYFRVLVVPDSAPKTKPKACNFGLAHAKGEFLVVYDAEDRADPLQLKKAYLAFSRLPQEVVCLQSKLNYYNPNQNLLTKLFTAEYSLWFDLILPGLQSINTIIPLGGTSNHFKTHVLRSLGGWDPFNVTEDCDLGVRLFKQGFKTAIIDSTTFEEANSNILSWIKQRSRWIKGYLQTYLVHTRNPFEFLRKSAIHAFIFQLVIGARTTFIIINPLLWFQTLAYFTLNQLVGSTIESFYPGYVYYFAAFSLVFGNFMYLYTYMVGCAKRRYFSLIKYMPLLPFYWFLSSIAALVAFYQLVRRPYFWEKTEHGLHLRKVRESFLIDILSFKTQSKRQKFFYPLRTLKFVGFIFQKTILDILGLFKPLERLTNPDKGGLRILIFNWRDIKHKWSGGAEVYIHELAKRWVKMGHKVTLFCGWDGEAKREETIDGVKIIRRGGFYTIYLLAFIYYIFKYRGKFDVVIDCENGIPFFTPLFVRIPKILLIHHVHQEVFRKHLTFPFSSFAIFLESKLMPRVYKRISFVTISESSKKDIVARGWAEEERVSVIHPGINPQLFVKCIKTRHPSFIYLGRLKPWKNVEVAIDAFENIVRKYPEARLTIAGFGESLPYLEERVKNKCLEGKVLFLGRVSEAQKPKLFSSSWAAIQPSSFEGWGITIIEANAASTPVIASNVNGLCDSVIDGRTGILFPLNNVEKLTEALEKVIADSNLRNFLSRNAYLWARRFSWDLSANIFMQVIKSCVIRSEFAPIYSLLKLSKAQYT